VRKRYNESKEHAFFCFLIRDLIRAHDTTAFLNVNKGADIEFFLDNKCYGIDIETGSILGRNPVYLARRYAEYRKWYAQCFIFVTKKKLKGAYAKYGHVLTRATVRKEIEGIFG